MKICVAGLRGIPGVMGGVETHCQELFPRLKGLDGKNEYIVLARKPYVQAEPYEYLQVRVVALPCLRGKYFEAASNTFLAVLYARFVMKADVIHIHAIGPALFAPLARILGLRIVITHHGKDYDRRKWNGFAKLCLQFGEHCAVLSANRVISVSKSLVAELGRRYPKQRTKIEYIPNGVTAFPRDTAERWELGDRLGLQKGRYILAVGRVVPEKGFHELIAAFRRMRKSGLKLVFVGKADHEDAYSRSLLMQASEDIVFAGFQGREELRQFYSYAALFVLPSHHEGLPIAALEAASFGIPVLLSDITANKDVGLPARNYFPAGDIEALSGKLASDYESLRVDSTLTADQFNWDAIARATAEVYSQMG